MVETLVYHHEPGKSGYGEINLFTYVYITRIIHPRIKQAGKEETLNMDSNLNIDYISKIGAVDKLPSWCDIVSRLMENEINN